MGPDSYKEGVDDVTEIYLEQYARDLRERRVKIAVFSATPQGGGVALMRHALVRHSNALGVDTRW